MNFSSIAMQWGRQELRVEKPGYPPDWSNGPGRTWRRFLLYTERSAGNQEKSIFPTSGPENATPATGLPAPGFRRSAPKALPDITQTLLEAILMINEIVTLMVRNIWYYGGKSIAE
jgi:hypothetical protein